MKAQSAMTRDVVCVTPHQRLADAYRWMMKWRVRHMPVVSGGRLVGIVSDRDVLLHATRTNNEIVVSDLSVSDAMTESPITIRAKTSVSKAAELMLEYKIDSLPVVEDGLLVGLVTSSDLLMLLIGDDESVGNRALPFAFFLKDVSSGAAA
jgi:acetoin utilization protein AcuB